MRTWMKKAREDKLMTMKDAADEIGISESYYSRIENGERQKHIDSDLVFKMSKVFGISVSQIFKYEYGEGVEQ